MVISCLKSNPRLINSDYIYRKIHKKAKRQIQRNEFASYEKTISQKNRTTDSFLSLQLPQGLLQYYLGSFSIQYLTDGYG